MASLNMVERIDISDSGIAGIYQRNPDTAILPDDNQSPPRSPKLYEDLLATDLSKHKTNADKLYEYCKAFQVLCKEQRSEIAKLQAAANLTKSPSKGSTRRETDDSKSSQKKEVKDTRQGIAVVFSPSDNGLRILQRRSMKGKMSSCLDPLHNTQHIYRLELHSSTSSFVPLVAGLSPHLL